MDPRPLPPLAELSPESRGRPPDDTKRYPVQVRATFVRIARMGTAA
jgi:hypothetical protein